MDLETLFKWTRELEILNTDGTPVLYKGNPFKLYQRVVGDADLNIARKEALRASRTLRKNLRKKGSDEAMTYLPDHNIDQDRDVLINMIIIAETLDLRRMADNKAVKPKEPKQPKSDASLEEQEEYEAAKEQWPKDVVAAINKEMDNIIDLRKEELGKKTNEELVKQLISNTIDSVCRTEMLRVFNSWCAYLGTYKNKAMTTRAFSSFEKFDNAAPDLKDQIISGYIELDMFGNDLKN